ncbi:hypothetical protein MUK42_30726 [Musa troglodytarum]|uniref:Uncharacterized protein n=1 Tax=Musa troglodytarum TaxID=320322 RepID=A0A9E7FKV5_9LILI|nr:hypothetical protein MUK42_30726 [Musa troglodytarum]
MGLSSAPIAGLRSGLLGSRPIPTSCRERIDPMLEDGVISLLFLSTPTNLLLLLFRILLR